jgi:hypothetical protein
VQALASGLRRLHQFQNKKEPVSETGAKERKKIQPQEEAGLRRRIFGESVEENPTEEDPVLNRPVCIHSISPVAVPARAPTLFEVIGHQICSCHG